MGYELYREIRDRAPADWTHAERLVALMIADDASDKTRKSWIKLPELMARTGIRTESGVRQALQRLAARGCEFRVPVGRGRDGRLVFATKGHSLDYLVPRLPVRQLPEGPFIGDCDESPNGDPKATVTDAKGDCDESPLSSAPLLSPSPQRSKDGLPAGPNWKFGRSLDRSRQRFATPGSLSLLLTGRTSTPRLPMRKSWPCTSGRRLRAASASPAS